MYFVIHRTKLTAAHITPYATTHTAKHAANTHNIHTGVHNAMRETRVAYAQQPILVAHSSINRTHSSVATPHRS